jgi:hypothetical protein
MSLLVAVSRNIEEYLKREIELRSRTEYFDSEAQQRIYFTKAFPISSVTHLWTTVTGKFTGEEVEETDLHLGIDSRYVVLRRNVGQYLRSVKIEYIGGLAADAVNSTFTLTSVGSAAFEEGQYVRGSKSRAVGKVVSNDPSTSIIIENIYGVFRVGDNLTAYIKEDLSGNAVNNTGGTISAIDSQSLVEAHPAIALATEFEVNYLYKNSTNSSLWVQSTNKEGTQKRLLDIEYNLQPETQMMLRGYERILA